jgi:hypothetical protein
MKPQKFKKIEAEGLLNKIQGNIESKLDEYDKAPFIKGVELTATVNTSDTSIDHGLGQIPVGYLILSQNANSVIWLSGSFTKTSLTLRASATVSITLWVF